MPSGASYSRRDAERLSSLVFFLDRQIGTRTVATALRAAGAEVELHDDHFPQATPDTVWIPEVAAKDWVLITLDKNIRRNPLERRAYQQVGLRGFVITGHGLKGDEIAALVTRALPGMARRAAGRPGPLLFAISAAGVFSKLI
jgi:hypothetical protein